MKAKARKRFPVKNNGLILRVIKSALFGCVITIVMILLFALLLKWEILSENSIPVATSIIKAATAAFVGLLCANGITQRSWLIAGIGGASYILLAFIAFTIVEKALALSLALLADICMGFIAGIAGSMIIQVKKTA